MSLKTRTISYFNDCIITSERWDQPEEASRRVRELRSQGQLEVSAAILGAPTFISWVVHRRLSLAPEK